MKLTKRKMCNQSCVGKKNILEIQVNLVDIKLNFREKIKLISGKQKLTQLKFEIKNQTFLFRKKNTNIKKEYE